MCVCVCVCVSIKCLDKHNSGINAGGVTEGPTDSSPLHPSYPTNQTHDYAKEFPLKNDASF